MRDARNFLTADPVPDIRGIDAGCCEIAPVGTEGYAVGWTVVPETSHLTHSGQLPNMCSMVVTGRQVVPVRSDAHPVGIAPSHAESSDFFSGDQVPYAHRALLTRRGKSSSVPAECNRDCRGTLSHVGYFLSSCRIKSS